MCQGCRRIVDTVQQPAVLLQYTRKCVSGCSKPYLPMVTRTGNKLIDLPGYGQFRVFAENSTWERSPRVNGRLILRSNSCDMVRDTVTSLAWSGPNTGVSPPTQANVENRSPPGFTFTDLNNQAYAKFQGKLRKGSASLGVTLASWRQSRDMIVNRSNHLGRTLDNSYRRLRGDRGAVERLRREREPLANQILETEFGWRPLFEDVHAALSTVCDGVPPQFLGSRARGTIFAQEKVGSLPGTLVKNEWAGWAMTSYSAKVEISNPNLWLLNRMGLINPATVGWDLIPWSFVVNMFVNVNAMINSVTDEVGLNVTENNVTRTKRLLFTNEVFRSENGLNGHSRVSLNNAVKNRYPFETLRPTWTVKVPELNWELAVIATSLVVQKFEKINRLIRLL